MECFDLEDFAPVARVHAISPRNHGPLPEFDSHSRITGPCGDTMEIWLAVRDGGVGKAAFETDGCLPSIARGSMTTVLAEGKPVESAAGITQQDILDALGGLPPEHEHCALLAAHTLRAACEDYLKHRKGELMNSGSDSNTCDTCEDRNCNQGNPETGGHDEASGEERKLQSRLSRIRHKIIVMSGKGGVGKSTVAVNLATSLMLSGKRVGLLDVDIHGPSIPTMLGLEGETVLGNENGLLPVEVGDMKVISLGFLLRDPDDAVIWRGPMKMGVIRQFLQDVEWGDLDYLIIDSPPGTGDEPLSVCQLIGKLDGAVIVTTPQKVAAVDVRKSITFCRNLDVPVLGVVENMSGFACPKCGEVTPVLSSGGGKQIATEMEVPFLGSIPMDPAIAIAGDSGKAFIHHYADSPAAKAMRAMIESITTPDMSNDIENQQHDTEGISMRIAIPLADGKLSMHFGHCQHFALVDASQENLTIIGRRIVEAPPHEPGLLPVWLAEHGATVIIAGGMGQRAQGLFTEQGIKVVIGAPAETPEQLVSAYLAGTLQSGDNICDH